MAPTARYAVASALTYPYAYPIRRVRRPGPGRQSSARHRRENRELVAVRERMRDRHVFCARMSARHGVAGLSNVRKVDGAAPPLHASAHRGRMASSDGNLLVSAARSDSVSAPSGSCSCVSDVPAAHGTQENMQISMGWFTAGASGGHAPSSRDSAKKQTCGRGARARRASSSVRVQRSGRAARLDVHSGTRRARPPARSRGPPSSATLVGASQGASAQFSGQVGRGVSQPARPIFDRERNRKVSISVYLVGVRVARCGSSRPDSLRINFGRDRRDPDASISSTGLRRARGIAVAADVAAGGVTAFSRRGAPGAGAARRQPRRADARHSPVRPPVYGRGACWCWA